MRHNHGMPPRSTRLVTQSLIISALRATERRPGVTWQEITDLSALIDVCCFFDEAHVLGRVANAHLRQPSSEMLDLLRSIVRTDYVAPDRAADVRSAATAHLLTVVQDSEQSLKPPATLSRLPLGDVLSLLDSAEDTDESIWGNEWTTGCPTDGELRAQIYNRNVFFIRTFLYIAYADLSDLSFTADWRRAKVVGLLLQREDDLASKLRQSIHQAYASTAAGGFRDIRKRVSPIAAVVFDRASKNGTSIASETRAMREELSQFRTTLRDAQEQLKYGTHDEALLAETKWNNAIEELQRAYGSEPDILTVRKLISFGPELARIADDASKYGSWTKALLTLPLEVASRIIARRTVVDLHQLRENVPAGGALDLAIKSLFGRVKEARTA